jgi:hypothetical protein
VNRGDEMPAKPRTVTRSDGAPTITKSQIAMSSLFSIAVAIPLIANSDHLLKSFAVWLLYTVVAGGVLAADANMPLWSVTRCALIPATTFFVTLTFITWLGLVTLAGICASCGSEPTNYVELLGLAGIYLAISIPTLVGLVFGAYGRNTLESSYVRFRKIRVSELKSLRTKINIVISIVSIVGVWLLSTR